MADTYCMKCSEPWDWFYLRDEVLADQSDFDWAEKQGGVFIDSWDDFGNPTGFWRFRGDGVYIEECPNCFGKNIKPDENAMIRSAMADILGDDTDGFIAEIEDLGLY